MFCDALDNGCEIRKRKLWEYRFRPCLLGGRIGKEDLIWSCFVPFHGVFGIGKAVNCLFRDLPGVALWYFFGAL